ncbi:TraR/DksA C4-type zinc finger protein [Patescibacteria group bacterium]|nr:TraR/DksA C4-type zinc finger protein [Patescibacteria group bacterium]MBU2579547.1 TraR/DksA C4-type zinc finger protein [Patescibacteria group bacterium]
MRLTEKEVKRLLAAERARTEKAITTTISKSSAELRAISATKVKNCRKDNHPIMMIIHSGRIAQLRKYLGKIKQAFENLENGKYGICHVCGCQIPTARLRVCPATNTCITCKKTLKFVTAPIITLRRETRAAAL